jgi:hypothetical protein
MLKTLCVILSAAKNLLEHDNEAERLHAGISQKRRRFFAKLRMTPFREARPYIPVCIVDVHATPLSRIKTLDILLKKRYDNHNVTPLQLNKGYYTTFKKP